HGHGAHGFGAAGDNGVSGSGADAFRGQSDSLQPRRAEAVDRHGGAFDRQAGAQRSDARNVHALLAFGHGAAENHVVNLFDIESGDARDGLFDGERGQIVRPRSAQRAFEGFTDGSADG